MGSSRVFQDRCLNINYDNLSIISEIGSIRMIDLLQVCPWVEDQLIQLIEGLVRLHLLTSNNEITIITPNQIGLRLITQTSYCLTVI